MPVSCAPSSCRRLDGPCRLSLTVLHDAITLTMRGDNTCRTRGAWTMSSIRFQPAAIKAHHEIEVFAPPEMVWDWISRVDLWSDWHPEIDDSKWVSDEGQGVFSLRMRKVLSVTSRIQAQRVEREFAWESAIWFFTTRHAFRIDGDYRRTTITCETWAEGPLARWAGLSGMFQNEVNRVIETGLGVLKTRLEREKRDESSKPPPKNRPRRPVLM